MAFFSLIGPIVDVIKFGGERLYKWSIHRDEVRRATEELRLSELKAKTDMAAYRIKSELEWDMKWASEASNSWKDEWLTILWTIPVVGVFIPPFREFFMDGFIALSTFPDWFLYGFGIIFAASFGMRQAASFMFPNKVASLVSAVGQTREDIPFDVARSVQDEINMDRTFQR